MLTWLFYYRYSVLRYTLSLYLPVGAGVAQKMWVWATLQIPLWNFHVSMFRKPHAPVVPSTRLGTNIFRGGPCHYLFSKEEPPLQIHWSSGLIKLIATGPKPSAVLNLLPSTRALDELCNLVCLVKQETYLKSLSTFSPKSSRNPPWLLQYFLGDAKSNQIKFLVGFWIEWCYEETKIQLIIDIHESTKA